METTAAADAQQLAADGLCGLPLRSAATGGRKGPPPPPPLFDLSGIPSRNETCAHCVPGADPDGFCCGVCTFEGRTCEERRPRERVSQRVLSQLLKSGFALGQLTPCELFQRIRGRTLWFMGDSQTWHFYLAVECFLHPFAVDYRRRNVTDDPELRLRLRPVTKPKERYPVCLQLREGTRVCALRADDAWAITRDVLPALRLTEAGRGLHSDIMVWNFGLHHPPSEKVYGAQLDHAAEFLDHNREWLPQMVWMDTPPQHFATYSGMFTKEVHRKPKPWQCVKMAGYNHTSVQQGGAFNLVALARVPRLGQAHLQTWHATLPLYYSHLNTDCTHFCSPGPYQLWTFLLNQVLREAGMGNEVQLPPPQQQQQQHGQPPGVPGNE